MTVPDKLTAVPLETLARLPHPRDNVAIAVRAIAAGQPIVHGSLHFALERPILEGHRFAVRPIPPGADLLSWGLPFGQALTPIPAGAYVCNAAMLEALSPRAVPFALPDAPNFRDAALEGRWDETRFVPGVQIPLDPAPRTFLGYPRPGGRGAGTRNMLVLLAATSLASSYVRALEDRLRSARHDYSQVDGVVAVTHTEGADDAPLNNRALLLRTLAGFMVHPNVGAVLVVEAEGGQVTAADLRAAALAANRPLDTVPHAFLALTGDFEADLRAGLAWASVWLPRANAAVRAPLPVAALNLALQCGGSDAFSGVSANPLAAAVAREIIRQGGAANMAETPEIMGAETYLLQNVRDLETARAVLRFIRGFKSLFAWHGVTGESNLSGGNRYRGLYNISLKSIGAAVKRDPAVRLDYAVDYGEHMPAPGFYFMNTPGNDLESIAGQVAGGSNLIIFTTGNGSITNFPFVPTIKVMTTTPRYQLLESEMDLNAGAYLDGASLEALAAQALDLTLAVASGQPSKGERAGHAQVSIWRNWRQTQPGAADQLAAESPPDGRPLPIPAERPAAAPLRLALLRVGERLAADQVGLILPTSLCAGQVAQLAANRLNELGVGREHGLSRFVALVHTEGCGAAGISAGAPQHGTLLSYMRHPLVGAGLFLEHGCEKTHNAFMRHALEAAGGDAARFGWASVQLDGGLAAALDKIEAWFTQVLADRPKAVEQAAGLEAVRLGLLTAGPVAAPLAGALARLARLIVGAGGLVVVPHAASLLAAEPFLEHTLGRAAARPSLGFGQSAAQTGFHLMQSSSAHWVENLSGLGASGVEAVLGVPGPRPAQGHPLVPVIQLGVAGETQTVDDFDLLLAGEPGSWAEQMLERVAAVLSRRYLPRRLAQGLVDFQLPRGLLGVSV